MSLNRIIDRLKRAAGPDPMSGGDPAAMGMGGDPAAMGGGDPMAGGGAPVPGVAPEQPMDMSAMQPPPGMQPGMQQPGMMPPQAPKVKIDPGTVIIQCVRMMTAVLENKQGKSQGDDLVDPGVIQAALTQAQNSMSSLVQQGEGGKPKVDINNGLVIIQKLTAALVDAEGIPMPASHMVATPDEMMAGGPGQQQQQPPAGGQPGMDPAAGNPGMPADPIQPIEPISADGGAAMGGAPKQAGWVDGVAMPAIPYVPPMNSSILARLKALQRR